LWLVVVAVLVADNTEAVVALAVSVQAQV